MEKLIELINFIDNNFDYIDIDDIYLDESNYISIFNQLSKILNNIELNNDMLYKISKIEKKEIFYQEIGAEFTNNKNRKKIVEYLNNDNLYIDYELVKKYIKDNYKLAKYIKDKSKMIDLVDINERVILLLPVEYLTEEFILESMKKFNFITEIFLGLHGDDNNLYNTSLFYRNNKEINDLLYTQSKKYIDNDIYIYIHSSDLVKSNIDIAKYVINIDSKFKHYVSEDLKDKI